MVVEICIIYYIYVINYTYLYHHIVVLDKYTNSNLVISFRCFLASEYITYLLLL